jgi:sulfoxide reductase heme-binding subunit YedZ
MTLPLFDTGGHSVDISSGALPQLRGERPVMEHGRGQNEQHGGRPTEEHGGRTEKERGGDQTEEHGGGSQASDEMMQGEQENGRGQQRLLGSRSFVQRFTVATGYVATGLLALTLLIGPANLLLGRRNPISTYLTRDVGVWAALFSVVHVFFGLQVHARLSEFLQYFLAPDGSPLANSFGLGNWTGLAATVIVVGLLATSSDLALRKLKAKRWKRLQRLNYALFALVLAHAFFYGALLRRTSPYTLLLLLSIVAVLVGQGVGVWLWRRRHARATARSA